MVKVNRLFLQIIFCFALVFFSGKAKADEIQSMALIQGLEAYRNGDWESASLFLRKAVADSENSTAECWYILVLSQMYSENYAQAVNDANTFIRDFSDSELLPYVEYQKGRALHYLGQNDSAALILSDFCHQNPEDAMYPSGLYWLAECFYDDYNFETARSLYEKITADFPGSVKAQDAQFKLDLIAQREREQKLLYLLKMTGEEYLNSREHYEKQLREYQAGDLVSLRKQLNAANARIAELEKENEGNIAELNSIIQEQQAQLMEQKSINQAYESARSEVPQNVQVEVHKKNSSIDEELATLKTKAAQIQNLLDEKNNGK